MPLDLTHIGPALLGWRKRILIGGALVAGGLTLAADAGGAVDRLLQLGRSEIRSHAASGDVHIVEIDARSIQAIARWPWPRSVHAEVVDRLRAAKARSIAFDVDFSATSTPAEDAKFAAALERADGSVVLPTFRQYAGAGSTDFVESLPAPQFGDHAFLAAVNVVPDRDGQVRSMPLGVPTAGVPRPSLASMVAERAAEVGRFFEVDYAIEPDSIPRHSVIDLIEGRVPEESIAGKRIVIGATAVEMGDRYAVPRHGVIPGVVIQAMGAETLMQGPVPMRIGPLAPLLLALALVALALKSGRRAIRITGLGLGTAIILALPLVTEAVWAVSMPIAPALAALGAASLLGLLLIALEGHQRRVLTDEATGLPNLAALGVDHPNGDRNVVVARIDRFAAIAAGLGAEATAILVNRVADRLRFGHSGCTIYRTDDATLAWTEQPGDEHSFEDRSEALATVMRAPIDCGRLVDVSLTFGLATVGAGAKQRVAHAVLAAQHAAQRGVRWERYNPADSDETNWHLSLLGELDAAMATGQLWNAYQPKLDLASGRVIGAEALVRWLHPVRGPIAPDSFIPLVESAGRARDLTIHVLGQALEDARGWEEAGHRLSVAVNVSATLLADHEFIEVVRQALVTSPIPTDRITIEVTESAAMASPERAIAALESWRSLGIAISIDDYGTGQSSLGYLQKLPARELKIDRSFVQTVATDQRNAIMVRSTIALAHELGMKVVAEGIEDEACLQALAAMGCDTGQGYHIAKPMPANAMREYLTERPEAVAA
ncbi:putative bifunctional diguanylate cyclase/phosphodiesterase [Allosphingosinicella indica]|uniref:EAL domain, c-di-GMP-specific phosphodiesterase class I (Or its enzymatically inactive variant) n=1 Tax=Allosphingosinicella indica TaxID=941907 RepID=A0A1X7GW86_9SPHN|nr:EAL domain-containing protein [Allosphingosinicella indica]SMF75174.1 EAL domain, c-di-GMP-specific phosphodiesterase class I (or its enzymatically inactive variant) [Allosphingosinicella indica]